MDQINMLGGAPDLGQIPVRELIGDGLVAPHTVLPADAPKSKSERHGHGHDCDQGLDVESGEAAGEQGSLCRLRCLLTDGTDLELQVSDRMDGDAGSEQAER
ncbi:hypothetical protein GCM10010317_101500 [Streptomyces mirabilis]|uniref:hypothetical protein n=1 Tax=Streptomyces mirabilis TaxID=68239 RepID=UPI0019A8551B|nr:hypothetical protein [Streptomyces mirabilis]GHD80047.1 hypothetical protein GCM10010317_101500 [Streptomyces mirabilis]